MIQTVPYIRNRHLVRDIDKGRLHELLVVVLLAGLLLLPLLLYVWNHMEWIRVGYELEHLKQERLSQAELGARLRIEKASLEALSRVETVARDRIGLVPAAAVVRLVEEPGGSVAGFSPPAVSRLEAGPGRAVSPDVTPIPESGDLAARSDAVLR
jgi:cell division protein FtsL